MRKFNIHHVDSFTDKVFGGNPTVAVLDAESLSLKEMRNIAKEMNLSETSFVTKSDKADVKLRFFTRGGDEVRFCGHATLGAVAVLDREQIIPRVNGEFKAAVETNAGTLSISSDSSGVGYRFEVPEIEMVQSKHTPEEMGQALGISIGLLDTDKPVMLEKHNNYLFFAAKSLEDLGEIAVDFTKATDFAKKNGYVVICIIAPGGFEKDTHIHTRGFAPLVGVPEDPFTGSMQGGAAFYALENRMCPSDTKLLHTEQGHFIGRPGWCQVEIVERDPFKAFLVAQAKHLYSGTLVLE